MPAGTLYLVRHGETPYIVEGRLGGDPPLTARGVAQARSVARLLEPVQLERIYCSTLLRARHTAAIIQATQPQATLIERPELVEISMGEFTDMLWLRFETEFRAQWQARERDKWGWCFPGGESYATAAQRVLPWLATVRDLPGEALIVGHRGVNRIILGSFRGLPQAQIPYQAVEPGELFAISLESGAVRRIEPG